MTRKGSSYHIPLWAPVVAFGIVIAVSIYHPKLTKEGFEDLSIWDKIGNWFKDVWETTKKVFNAIFDPILPTDPNLRILTQIGGIALIILIIVAIWFSM